MARGGITSSLIKVGAVFLVWRAGTEGALGSSVQTVILGLQNSILGRQGSTANAAPLTPGGSNSGGTSSTLQSILAINPNFWAQMQEWQAARARNGENAYDWQALRAHLMAIGAPDPGPTAPAEFNGPRG